MAGCEAGGSGVRARSLERIGRLCESGADARTLRLSLLDELRRTLGFDAYAWLLTDPETSVGVAPLADVPCLPELPEAIRLKYLTGINRWTTLADPPVGLLHDSTGGELSRSLLWQGMLSRYDVVDVASIVFRDEFGCWAFLDLWRRAPSGRFSAAEAGFLTGITKPVAAALRRAQAATFATSSAPERRRVGPIVLLLGCDLRVLAQTPETQEYLRVLVPPAPDRPPIPASAYNVGAQLLAREADVDRNPPSARVHLFDGRWVTLRAARIGDADPPGRRDIAVTIEESSSTERVSLFSRVFGLTVREADLLGHLVAGRDTRELARLMVLSEYTVQDHLKAIFAKTSTRSRRTLLAHALGS